MSKSPQVVLDTNAIYSGLRSRRGASFKLLSLLGTGRFEIHLSVPLVLEYEEVLQEKSRDLRLAEGDIDDVLNYLCRVAGLHEIHFLWRPRLKDPDDEMILELAVEAGCDYIVTYRTFRAYNRSISSWSRPKNSSNKSGRCHEQSDERSASKVSTPRD
jgi:putative PIN family toxin of toxin-antitoxin system